MRTDCVKEGSQNSRHFSSSLLIKYAPPYSLSFYITVHTENKKETLYTNKSDGREFSLAASSSDRHTRDCKGSLFLFLHSIRHNMYTCIILFPVRSYLNVYVFVLSRLYEEGVIVCIRGYL